MRKLLIPALLTAGLAQAVAAAAGYTQLSTPWCDNENKVIYDGKGYFAVQSAPETVLELTLSLPSLLSYVNSNDYKSGSPLLLWDADVADCGIADNADMHKPTGSREPFLTGFCLNKVWQPELQSNYTALKQYADAEGLLRLCIRNSKTTGVIITAKDAAGKEHTLYEAPALRISGNTTTHGYRVNTNYVTAVSLHTPSMLDTSSYEAPPDYTARFVSKKTSGPSLGRLMFMGDSITHGVNDQTWRWQLFKTLVDNGVEAQIVGPRSGYTPGYTNLTTPDAGDSYGGVLFPNVHLAQSSGRTHNIISGSNAGMSGVNYGGHSTRSSADTYNCDTWCCLMGTNDLLSDRGYTPADFCDKMQKMLGGRVSMKGNRYTWTPGKIWGNLGRMAEDVLRDADDVLYVMAVPCWGRHGNNNEADRHLAVQQYNGLLKQWVKKYAKAHNKRLVYVDINNGMVDNALPTPFCWPDSMSNKPGLDGLHPNAQGSLIIAGNLARAMGLAGRTAGLPRETDEIRSTRIKTPNVLKPGDTLQRKVEAFSAEKGYSIVFRASYGNGAKNGWRGTDEALTLRVGDGTNGGTLRISESCILWGDTPLYCTDCSRLNESLRLVWHPGNEADNVQRGYYVWLGDMLIGQGLPANGEATVQGFSVASDKKAEIEYLRWLSIPTAP
ncbi:MAG: SGNH/GDSL hydrolase family protein [Akkermansia sp.]|nr:SGNH/GDSL hydrolase family protein [Akkermansia sp.]